MPQNPFRAGAGHPPPYLAGRDAEKQELKKLLRQDAITKNIVLTGLRGIGKTVLLNQFKPLAREAGWRWTGTDLSESASISEANLAVRVLADAATATASIPRQIKNSELMGFKSSKNDPKSDVAYFDYEYLETTFKSIPGLLSDKLRGTLLHLSDALPKGTRIVFAYDEAQNLSDHAAQGQFPMSMLLETFQALQREGTKFLLILVGLPTLGAKLVEARTYSERMFTIMTLGRLSRSQSLEAIKKPIEVNPLPFSPTPETYQTLCDISGGYPYFIQFFCYEMYEIWLNSPEATPIPVRALVAKLDSDFFAGRWENLTDRQRDLLRIIARIENPEEEFTVQESVEMSQDTQAPFGASQVSQLLTLLAKKGLVFRPRHGKYKFAVPMLGDFIRRQF